MVGQSVLYFTQHQRALRFGAHECEALNHIVCHMRFDKPGIARRGQHAAAAGNPAGFGEDGGRGNDRGRGIGHLRTPAYSGASAQPACLQTRGRARSRM